MNLKSWFAAGALVLSLSAQPSLAGENEDALAARERGDLAVAVEIWSRLAAEGHAAAQYNLAVLYEKGEGVPQDDHVAVGWYQRSGGFGYAPAQLELAVRFDEGRGVSQSLSRALKWYRRAAQQGNPSAQVALGLIYATGRGVPRNDWQAVKWLGLAAAKGDPIAQNQLGLIYAEGQGIEADLVQAYMWHSLAAAAGAKGAVAYRDALAARLSPEQLSQAQTLADDWLRAKAQEKAAKCQNLGLEECR